MRLIDTLRRGARVIEFEPRDGRLGEHLQATGRCRYLGVVKNAGRWSQVVRRSPKLNPHVAISCARERVRQNNADLLVLRGASVFHLARYRNIRHASFVAVPLEPGPLMSLALMFGLLQFLLGRLAWPQIVLTGDGAASSGTFALYRVRRPRPYTGTRRFIPHWLGVSGLLDGLVRTNTRHAVLRWFEKLPEVAAGEDLDLLVDDAALAEVRDVLDSSPGLQPIDVYSVNGAPGADYRDMPYFPPYLANELLDRAKLHRKVCRVPAPREHFLSMAYHALYHKGTASGLPHSRGWKLSWSRPKHDYSDVLRRMANRLGVGVPMTLADLDAYLDAQGWRPPHDMLYRLSRKNKWLRSHLTHAGGRRSEVTPVAGRKAA